MHPDLDSDDREAAMSVALTLVICAVGLYALKAAGFRFVIGVGD